MKIKIALCLLCLTGCSNPQQHVWKELDACKQEFNEECTLVVIPESKTSEIRALYKKWGNK